MMRHRFGKLVVIALGGSVVCPDGVDLAFLKKFRTFLLPFARKRNYILVVGGGRLSRLFQDAAVKLARVTDEDKDWVGIHATRLNAQLVRTLFHDVADPVVFDARRRLRTLAYPVTVASGWKPGWSTDYVALRLAADFGAKEVVIAGKPAYVYTKDHARYAGARPLPTLTWKEYNRLIPKTWSPGLHAPVDPVAARLAAKKGIAAAIINGKDLKNFGNLLKGADFRGSIIR